MLQDIFLTKRKLFFKKAGQKKPKQGITNFEFININQPTIYLFKTLKDNDDAAVVDISANKAAAFVNYQGIHALEYDIIALLLQYLSVLEKLMYDQSVSQCLLYSCNFFQVLTNNFPLWA